MARHTPLLLLIIALLLLILPGCARHPPDAAPPAPPFLGAGGASSDALAPGVYHRSLPTGDAVGVDLVDVDLGRASVRIAVATEDIKRVAGLVTGKAYTPHEWLDKTKALAATNGGYFGLEVRPDRKEIVGLLVQGGRVRRAAPPLRGHGGVTIKPGRYVRSAFGLTADGQPDIEWAATDEASSQVVRYYTAPMGVSLPASFWTVRTAVGCGPTLFHHTKRVVTDRQERLVSPGGEARTFVAYDGPPGAPRHFVLAMASDMDYRDIADFLQNYFSRYDHSRPTDAMCLDGGASTQMSYRSVNGSIHSPRETGVTVPDAVVILPR